MAWWRFCHGFQLVLFSVSLDMFHVVNGFCYLLPFLSRGTGVFTAYLLFTRWTTLGVTRL
jgi:hypothetical protein